MRRFPLIVLFLAYLAVLVVPAAATDDMLWRFPAAPRIVAIGDVHGDLDATRRALKLAGAIDDKDHWIGGKLVLVQTGDQLDRGNDEQLILELFDRLIDEASAAGGAFHPLNGNHEMMNALLDLRYVTPGGYEDFQDAVTIETVDEQLAGYEDSQRARVAAFRPGGKYATLLARRNTVIMVGDNVFVHGGVLPRHVDYGLQRLNAELRVWMRGEGSAPEWTKQKDSPVWMRHYSLEVDDEDCTLLGEALEKLGARRMIVGHTIQEEGIASYCDGMVWCIDVGMSAHYGGTASVLEIRGDSIQILK